MSTAIRLEDAITTVIGISGENIRPTNLYDLSDSTSSSVAVVCPTNDPTSEQFLSDLSVLNICLLAVICGFALLSLVIYCEEIVFLLRHFPSGGRRNKTMWLLAYFPVFSVTAMLAVLVPRSSTLIDIVANTFFATCLFQFLGLIQDYLGGKEARMHLVDQSRLLTLSTPPLCCCLVCLPQVRLTRKKFMILQCTILQFVIIRPLLMFIAGVLWTNGSYIAGYMNASSAYLYITILNVLCTLVAMYGLMLIKGYFQPELEPRYRMAYKVGCIQLCLICSLMPKLIVSILVLTKVLTCTTSLSAKTRSEVICHAVLTVIMPLFAILGRLAFGRHSDAWDVLPENQKPSESAVNSVSRATIDESSDNSTTTTTDSVSTESTDDDASGGSGGRKTKPINDQSCRLKFCYDSSSKDSYDVN